MTLPLLGPTIRVSVFLSIIGALQLFDLVWVTTGGGPVNASNTMATYMFDWGFKRFQLGYGSAVAVILFVLRPRPRPGLPALRPASGHRGRHDDRGRVAMTTAGSTPTTETATRPVSAAARPPVPAAIRLGRLAWAIVRYGLLLLVAAVIVVPIAYAVLGGFKDPAQLANDPVGLPDPWVTANYTDTLTSPSFWRQLANSTLIAALSTVLVVLFAALAAFVFARRTFPGREVAVHAVHARPAVPGRRRDPAAVHPGPRPRAARQPARGRAARGGVRPAADDRHPAAVLPEHPERAGGRRGDRRLRAVRVLLAGPPAAVAAGPRDGRGPGHRLQLEPVPAARW